MHEVNRTAIVPRTTPALFAEVEHQQSSMSSTRGGDADDPRARRARRAPANGLVPGLSEDSSACTQEAGKSGDDHPIKLDLDLCELFDRHVGHCIILTAQC